MWSIPSFYCPLYACHRNSADGAEKSCATNQETIFLNSFDCTGEITFPGELESSIY